jgi:hypothetical protein
MKQYVTSVLPFCILYAYFLSLVGNVEIPFARSFNADYPTTLRLHNPRLFFERVDLRKQNREQHSLNIKHSNSETKIQRIAFCRYFINAPVSISFLKHPYFLFYCTLVK